MKIAVLILILAASSQAGIVTSVAVGAFKAVKHVAHDGYSVVKHGATLLPVDSEHNAIFQCLAGNKLSQVRWITLTASGGPFRDWTHEQLALATPAQAVKHPNWDMGAKISVDNVQQGAGTYRSLSSVPGRSR